MLLFSSRRATNVLCLSFVRLICLSSVCSLMIFVVVWVLCGVGDDFDGDVDGECCLVCCFCLCFDVLWSNFVCVCCVLLFELGMYLSDGVCLLWICLVVVDVMFFFDEVLEEDAARREARGIVCGTRRRRSVIGNVCCECNIFFYGVIYDWVIYDGFIFKGIIFEGIVFWRDCFSARSSRRLRFGFVFFREMIFYVYDLFC